jgi:hypothetical protein
MSLSALVLGSEFVLENELVLRSLSRHKLELVAKDELDRQG